MSTVDDILAGGGTRPASWETIGATHKGEILSVEVVQSRDIQTGEPAFWKDGQPKEQIRVVIQTDEHEDEEDDGRRAIYLKGGKATVKLSDGSFGRSSLEAVKEALKTAKCKGLEVGATLGQQYVANGERTQPGFNPPKTFKAAYKPPVAAAIDPNALI